jgi:hypothetical protein
VLRDQLNVLQQRAPHRLCLTWIDRALFVWLYRGYPRILDAITILRPETIVRWHRKGFAAFWRWKSRPLGGRPQVDKEVRDLIRRMRFENGSGRPREKRHSSFRKNMYLSPPSSSGIRNPRRRRFPEKSRKYVGSARERLITDNTPRSDIFIIRAREDLCSCRTINRVLQFPILRSYAKLGHTMQLAKNQFVSFAQTVGYPRS